MLVVHGQQGGRRAGGARPGLSPCLSRAHMHTVLNPCEEEQQCGNHCAEKADNVCIHWEGESNALVICTYGLHLLSPSALIFTVTHP